MVMPMTFGMGMSTGAPDVCKTPPFMIPAPMPNMAANVTAVPAYMTIMIMGMPELNMASMNAITNGDEAGTMGGVISFIIVGPARPLMGSMMYFVGGLPSWRMTAPTMQNLVNAPGVTSVPSQVIKTVLR